MKDLRDKDIIGEYLVYVDENYNKCKGNAYRYEASDSLLRYPKGTDGAEEMFLIVDSWDFIREFNSWAKDKYGKELYDETRYDLPENEEDRKYFTTWLDYLTQDMWGFYDEYSVCEHCNKAFRSSPDSYSWTQNYWLGDGFIICEDCVKEDYAEEYLESLQNNPHTANTILSDSEMENAGYEKVNADSYESGWYGRCEDPEEILEKEMENNPDYDYIFSICGSGQFHTEFDLWRKIA